jgi:para-nitrobenzyl esterase
MPGIAGRIVGRARVVLGVIVASAVLAGDNVTGPPAKAQTPCFVTVSDGAIQGLNLGGACAFLGVPYAGSPAGEHRWKPPQPVVPWSSVLNATAMPPLACAQVSFFGTTPSFAGGENCLTLNVWARNPLPSTPAPVIVWLHPGAFIGASGFFNGTRGQTLAAETGVIVVAPNYRVGAFGVLAHPALTAEDPDGSSGNYGLLDQRAAMQWVQDNIAQFGGDPGNVTLAGASAGGQSVGLHMTSPGSAGLFHRAIVQSAYPTTRWQSAVEAEAQGEAFATALGCTDAAQVLACMRQATPTAVMTALTQASQQVAEPAGQTFWEPSVDGVVLQEQPRLLFESGAFHRVPTIVGFTRDEGWGSFITRSFGGSVTASQYEAWVTTEFGPHAASVLALYAETAAVSSIEAMARIVGDGQFACEARRLARTIEQTGTPVFMYSYEYEIDTLSLDHVIHGVESNIVFGNNYLPPVFVPHTLNDADLALHRRMAGYWTRFAAAGNPNHGADNSILSWPPFTRPHGAGRGADKHIIFDASLAVGARVHETACDFFEPLFLRSVLAGLPASAP